MSNGDGPTVHDLIAEAHAAREAGDQAQMDAALNELQRVTDEANQPDQDLVDAETPGARLGGGVKGALEGVGDLATGAVKFGAGALEAYLDPSKEAKFGGDVVHGVLGTVPHLREVTQRFREGDATPEELARAWTGGSGTVLGTVGGLADASGVTALDESPRFSLSTPLRSLAGKAHQGLLKAEGAISPRTALYRIRLKQAQAATQPSRGTPIPGLQTTGEDIGASQQVDLSPSAPPRADPMDIPTYLRRAAERETPPADTPDAAPENPAVTDRLTAAAKHLKVPVDQLPDAIRDAIINEASRGGRVETSPQVSSRGTAPTNPKPFTQYNDRGQPTFRHAGKVFAKTPAPDAVRDALVDQVAKGGNRPRPGHPIFAGDRSFTRSAEVRARVPSKTPDVSATLKTMSFDQLREVAEKPTTAQELRQAILVEFKRRGINYSGGQ